MTTRSMPQRGSANAELPDDDADLLGSMGLLGSVRVGAGRDEVDDDSDLIDDDDDADLVRGDVDLPETDDDLDPEAESESVIGPSPTPPVRSERSSRSQAPTPTRMPIFDPLHNVRECSKQLVLLEDHLEHPPKHCPDCIRKHLLTAEAFAEEAVSLDKVGRYQDVLGLIPDRVRALAGAYVAATPEQRHVVAQKVRVLRKELSKLGFDALPDGTDGAERAASGALGTKKGARVGTDGDDGDPSAMGGAEVKPARKIPLERAAALVRDALAGESGVFGVSPGAGCVVVRATPATAARLPAEALGWPVRAVSEPAPSRAGSKVGPGAWLQAGKAKPVGRKAVSVGAAALTAPMSGWDTKPGVRERMTAEQYAFMDSVRAALPTYIPLRVNSSFRTPEEQAEVMRAKLAKDSSIADLRKLYGNSAAINEVLERDPAQWGGVIQFQVSRSPPVFLSRHLRHDALDLSAKLPEDGSYMSRAWQEAIVAAAQAAGASRAFIEDVPPNTHIHVERLGAPASGPGTSGPGTNIQQQDEGGNGLASWLPWVLVGAGVVAVVGFGLFGGGAALMGAGALFGFGSDTSRGVR